MPASLLQVLQFVLTAVGGGVGVALWFYATGGRRGAQDSTTDLRLDTLERRMEDGGRRSSDLTSKILILPAALEKVEAELARLRIEMVTCSAHVSDLRVAVRGLEVAQQLRRNGAAHG